jgi:hypothetical protein
MGAEALPPRGEPRMAGFEGNQLGFNDLFGRIVVVHRILFERPLSRPAETVKPIGREESIPTGWSRSMLSKKSIFGVDHISHDCTRPSRKLSRPIGREFGLSAYVHRNRFATSPSSENHIQPAKAEFSPVLNF